MLAGPHRLGHRIVSGIRHRQHRAELRDGACDIQRQRPIRSSADTHRTYCNSRQLPGEPNLEHLGGRCKLQPLPLGEWRSL